MRKEDLRNWFLKNHSFLFQVYLANILQSKDLLEAASVDELNCLLTIVS